MSLPDQLQRTLEAIRRRAPGTQPKLGIILGSGLGSFADHLTDAVSIPYADLPEFPSASVVGHAGRLVLGKIGGEPIAALQGRVHFYEGHAPAKVVYAVRVLGSLGIRKLVVTNAAGGVNLGFQSGDLMAIRDHLNLAGWNPLVGQNEDSLGPRFPDMSHTYDPELLGCLEASAKAVGVTLRSGVYACLSGPSYETPAEIRMLRILGADAVGMSTVPEVIVAAHMGMRVAGISCITNLAAGIGLDKLSHEEVSETAGRVQEVFTRLLTRFLPAAATL